MSAMAEEQRSMISTNANIPKPETLTSEYTAVTQRSPADLL